MNTNYFYIFFLDGIIEEKVEDTEEDKIESVDVPIDIQNGFDMKNDFDVDVPHDHIELKVVEPKQEQLDSTDTIPDETNETQTSEFTPNSSNNDLESK